MNEADKLMAQILDAAQEVGGERVLRELEDAGLIEWHGMTDDGAPIFTIVRG